MHISEFILNCQLAKLTRRDLAVNHVAHFFSHDKNFMNCHSSFVPCAGTERASLASKKSCAGRQARKSECYELLFTRQIFFFAAGANSPDKTLRNDTDHGGTHPERRYAEIDHSGNCTDGIIGMKSADNTVPRQGSFSRDHSGFCVPDFSHKDDVRVLAQYCTEHRSKRQAAF